MITPKQIHRFPLFRIGLTLGLGLWGLLVALALASESSAQASVHVLSPQVDHEATMPVTYTLDDFDDRIQLGADYKPRSPNDFFGNQGRWDSGEAVITETTVCSETFECYLGLAYDLSVAGTAGGYWEEFGYSYLTATLPSRDLREFEALRFRVQGDPVHGFPDQFQVEFVQNDWAARAVYTVTGVTTDWHWVTVELTGAGAFDWSRVKHVAINLEGNRLADKTGQLFVDDLALVDRDFSGDFLDLIEHRAFLYFWELRHPTTGFVRDRAVDPFYGRNVTSVAAVGFELTAFGIGAERGWISRTEAATATYQVLNTLLTLPQGPTTTATSGYQGFFYHMLDIDTGVRAPDSEVSTIDTALLMAGVLFTRQYYTGTNQTEVNIRAMATQLYDRIDWDWVLRTEPEPADKTDQFYMAWKPEFHDCESSDYQNCYEIPDTKSGQGYFIGMITDTMPITRPTTWNYYTDEIVLINLLAIGSPTHSVPADTFWAWARVLGTYNGHTLYQSWYGQLFAHFIGQEWLDLRRSVEKKPPHINWWLNSQQAVLADRQFVVDQAMTYSTYSPLSWGLSSCLGPPDNPLMPLFDGVGEYRGYGALPKGDTPPPLQDGTVAPYAAAGSIMFLSSNPADNVAYQTLENWFYNQPRLWGVYGFRDGFNLDQGWFAHDYIGLDQGMTLLAIENYQTELVWNTFSRDPAIDQAMSAVFNWNLHLPVVIKNN